MSKLEGGSLAHLLLVTMSNVTGYMTLAWQDWKDMSRLEDNCLIHLLLLVTERNFTV